MLRRTGSLREPGATARSAPHVVLYVIDTLRRDRLGLYGYDRPTSPRIDALGRECTVFERAYAPAPWTLPSVVSLLTSRDPLDHQILTRGQRLGTGVQPLAERLHADGWRTAAFVTNPFAGRASGLDRGYDHFVLVGGQSIGPHALVEWLDGAEPARTFVYLHSTEPHRPYKSPQRFRDRLGDVPARRRGQLNRQVRLLQHLTNWDFRRGQPPGETDNEAQQTRLRRQLAKSTAELSALYDAEVAWADDDVGRVVDALRARRTWSSTLFVLVADHGDEIFDHGDLTHGQSLYAELTRVPMIVCHPDGLGAGRRIDTVVSLLDVMPTVLAYAGLPVDGLAGGDLTPLLRGEAGDGRPRVTSVRVNRHKYSPATQAARGAVNLAIADGRWQGIWNVQPDTLELYDTRADPREQHDLAAREPSRAAAMRELARHWSDGRWPDDLGPQGSATETMDERTIRRLRELGYLE